jgi:hypothetical protein
MQDLEAELERRSHRRQRPRTECEVMVGARRYEGTIEDVSRGGVFVRTDADASRGAIVRVRWDEGEHFGVVVHCRTVPRSLRWALHGGLGLRWTRLS